MTRPQVTLSSVQPDSDFHSIQNSARQAFLNSATGNRARRSIPNETPPSYEYIINQKADAHRRSLVHQPAYEREVLAALASSPEKPVGYALWYSPVDRTSTGGDPLPEEIEVEKVRKAYLDRTATEADKELKRWTDAEFVKLYTETMENKRKEYFQGRKHWYLHLLWVDPNFQGQGISRPLIEYGLSRAKEDGVPVYLTASSSGQPVYERFGFKKVDLIEFLPVVEGGEAIRFSVMVIDP